MCYVMCDKYINIRLPNCVIIQNRVDLHLVYVPTHNLPNQDKQNSLQKTTAAADIIFKMLIFSKITISHQGILVYLLEQLALADFCEKRRGRKRNSVFYTKQEFPSI